MRNTTRAAIEKLQGRILFRAKVNIHVNPYDRDRFEVAAGELFALENEEVERLSSEDYAVRAEKV